MAQNMFRRAMAYLGLVDEEYDDLDRPERRAPVSVQARARARRVIALRRT